MLVCGALGARSSCSRSCCGLGAGRGADSAPRSRFAGARAAAARLGRALALRPLAGGAAVAARSPRSSPGGTGSAPGLLGLGGRDEALPGRARARSPLVWIWRRARPARGAAAARRPRRGRRCRRLPAVRRALAARGLAQRDARRRAGRCRSRALGAGVLLVAAPGRRARRDDALEPRLAEPRRRRARRARASCRRSLQVAALDRDLDLVRPRPGRPRAARPRVAARRSARSSPSARCSRRSS